MATRENVISLWERHGPPPEGGLESRSSLHKFLAQSRYRCFAVRVKECASCVSRMKRVTQGFLISFPRGEPAKEPPLALTILPNRRRKLSPLHRLRLPSSIFNIFYALGGCSGGPEIRNGSEIQAGQDLHTYRPFLLGSYFLNLEDNRTRRQPTKTRQTMGDRTESHAFDFSCFSDRIIGAIHQWPRPPPHGSYAVVGSPTVDEREREQVSRFDAEKLNCLLP
ncbi:hypothetical protein K0M31_010878 [Melipona bicolor]|uniref:Uncharacterized protein n=1 Tax=Melipona bicolor TaxID=60889 RepID=A0AA40FL14_9HYME|nr:hypothetical protein K0M31_010878 [Melipona bicolor]